MDGSLTEQEEAFAIEYIVDYDHKRAAEVVGKSRSSALSLLRKPKIQQRVQELQEENKLNSIITRDFINTQYLQLLDIALGRVETNIVLNDGSALSVSKTSVSDAISVVDKLSKSIEYIKPANVNVNPEEGMSVILNITGTGMDN